MWAALHVTQIACRVSLPKCQIPNSFNKIVLIGNSAPLVVYSNSSNDLCLNLPDKDLCWLVSVRSKGRRGGDKGKHDTETLVSHQIDPLDHCVTVASFLTYEHRLIVQSAAAMLLTGSKKRNHMTHCVLTVLAYCIYKRSQMGSKESLHSFGQTHTIFFPLILSKQTQFGLSQLQTTRSFIPTQNHFYYHPK